MVFGLVSIVRLKDYKSKNSKVTPLNKGGCGFRQACTIYPDNNHMYKPKGMNVPYDCDTLNHRAEACPLKRENEESIMKGYQWCVKNLPGGDK